jgi:hypothetical protein
VSPNNFGIAPELLGFRHLISHLFRTVLHAASRFDGRNGLVNGAAIFGYIRAPGVAGVVPCPL